MSTVPTVAWFHLCFNIFKQSVVSVFPFITYLMSAVHLSNSSFYSFNHLKLTSLGEWERGQSMSKDISMCDSFCLVIVCVPKEVVLMNVAMTPTSLAAFIHPNNTVCSVLVVCLGYVTKWPYVATLTLL